MSQEEECYEQDGENDGGDVPRVKNSGQDSVERQEFGVEVGLLQGSALILFLDGLTVGIRDIERWELLFVDDLVIKANTKEEVKTRVLQ